MVDGDTLARLLELTAARLRASLEDLSPEEMVARPQGLAPVLWQVGHLALTEARLLREAGAPAPVPEGYGELFARGSRGEGPFPDGNQVRDFFETIHGRMKELARGDLARPVPSSSGLFQTAGEGVTFMLYHRGYHQGKIMTLRALLGKPRLLG